VTHRSAYLLVILAACGGGAQSPAPVDTATSPDAAVRFFMQAVADSNISRMGRYWGSVGGPAAQTGQPPDYITRMAVTQAYLRKTPYRIVRVDPVVGNATRNTVSVSLTRTDLDGTTCEKLVPFIVLNTGKEGWIITALDLTQVGTPGHSCAGVAPKSPSP